jgi:RND family efflux transporter MFP subunit
MLISGCAPEPEAEKASPLVPAMRLAGAEELTKRAFPGRARAGQEVNLSFRVSGPLIELPANVGDEVMAGDVVARIDPQDYVNALGTATGTLQAAQATARKAAADYKRIQNVFKEDPGATSQTAIDLARAARDSSRAAANSLTSAVKAAQDQLDYTSLKAPFSGVVVVSYVENFETVLAKQPVLRLLNPTSIEFVISVPENQITYAPYVDNVVVNFDALPGVDIPATIKEIGREASQATRTYPVTLVMDQPDDAEIMSGMAGSARVSARLPEGARATGMQLPATAIFAHEDPEKSYVWVIDATSKTLKSRAVETGQLTGYGVTIRSGLSAGEWVVVKGVHSVSEGQTVRIMDISGEDTAP